ncbi:hypothetical protein LUZ60_011096 [Juncus effusus]|nr:hypothetical protein LUZ60_011096 [Juncus effusus]
MDGGDKGKHLPQLASEGSRLPVVGSASFSSLHRSSPLAPKFYKSNQPHLSPPFLLSPSNSLLQVTDMAELGHGSPGGGGGDSGGDGAGSPRGSGPREQDRFLPIANISRIMKKAIPANGKIAKDAKETVQECVSEFISFITSEASDKCQREKRKTINGDDLLWAMSTLGFEDYIDPLKLYLQKYREGDKTSSGRGDGSKKDGGNGSQVGGPSSQPMGQVAYTQGMPYMQPQVHIISLFEF